MHLAIEKTTPPKSRKAPPKPQYTPRENQNRGSQFPHITKAGGRGR